MSIKRNHFTFIFIPEDNGKTYSLRINKFLVTIISVIFSILLFLSLILLFKSGQVAATLQLVHSLKSENDKLQKENKKIKETIQIIEAVEYQLAYLEKLAVPRELQKSVQKKEITDSAVYSDSVNLLSDELDIQEAAFSKNDISSLPNISPVEGWITRGYSSSDSGHSGIDFAAALGTPIRATAPGIVLSIVNDKYLGLMVLLKHSGDIVTRYGHCSQILVSKGDRIKRGQTIALVGNTGRSTAPHLHYELIKDGKNHDPSNFIIGHQD